MARVACLTCLAILFFRAGVFAAEEEGAAQATDWSRYEIVLKRNIFDPNRSPGKAASAQSQPAPPETLDLTGVLEQPEGQVAFFEGTVLKKGTEAVKEGQSVAGLKVARIRTDGVLLSDDQTTSTLRVGRRIARPTGGQWDWQGIASAPAEDPGRGTADGSTADASKGGDSASKALEKLKERRRKELGS